MHAIEIEGLTRRYGRVQALDGLDLTVERGSVFGFLGPNGAGKTTTLRILTGLARATSGFASVAGVPVGSDREALARHIGYLPEEPAFYSWMTPREFLDYVGRTFGLGSRLRAARVGELLEQAGLVAVAGRRIGGFSRGMRQRLGLAQALVNRPELLLLDEPVSALDPAGRREVLEVIGALRGSCTVFMSTHILADVERVCDTVGIVAAGKLLITAKQSELLERYALPAFELEADNGSAARMAAWSQEIVRQSWVSSATLEGAQARIVVSDLAAGKQALLPSALGAGLTLTRFEMMRPSLEEVFLRLVENGKV
ncbi:MAG: ABC transporter ATP-binding protein [Anaerolineae bacterium]